MAEVIQCDHCEKVTADADGEWWLVVGWAESEVEDACSVECATALLGKMAEHKATVEAETGAL